MPATIRTPTAILVLVVSAAARAQLPPPTPPDAGRAPAPEQVGGDAPNAQIDPSALVPKPPAIVVTGRGEALVAPTGAVVRLGAVAEGDDAAEAQARVTWIVEEAIRSLGEAGVPEDAIETVGATLLPIERERPRARRRRRRRGPWTCRSARRSRCARAACR